ncbi:DUF2339 domain-containing protein [Acinetobacter sp. ANC 5383]
MLQKKSAVMMSLVLMFSVILAWFAYVFGTQQWAYLLLLAGLCFFIVLIFRLQNQVDRLEQRLSDLERQQMPYQPASAPVQVVPPPMPVSIAIPPQPAEPQIAFPSQTNPHWQAVLEWLVKGNLILKVAVVLLLIGVVLLLRFASEYWQVSLGMRLLSIGVVGAITTAIGYWLGNRNLRFAVAVQGVGLAVIFLTLIFAHHFLLINSVIMASVVLAGLLLITTWLSLKQKEISLAILALGMAYLAPLLIPQYRPDPVFLWEYYLVVNLAVAAINFVQSWKLLNHLAFFSTMGLAGMSLFMHDVESQRNYLDMLLWLHLALFIWLSIRYSQLMLRQKSELQGYVSILDVGLIFSVPVFGFTLHASLMHQSSHALTLAAAGLAAVYFGLTVWIRKRQAGLSLLGKSFMILATAFFALIFPLAKGAHWTSLGWVIQGTALIVWGVTERYRFSRIIGEALLFCSAGALFFQIWSDASFPTLSACIYTLVQSVAVYFLLQDTRTPERRVAAIPPISFFLVFALYSGSAASVEIFHWQAYGLLAKLAVTSVLYAVFYVVVNLKQSIEWIAEQLIISTIILIGLVIALEQLQIWQGLQHWKNSGFALFCAVAALLQSGLLYWTQRQHDSNRLLALLLWASLALAGLSLWVQAPIMALGALPTVWLWTAIIQKNKVWLQHPELWLCNLLWLLLVNIDQDAIQAYYVIPLFNPIDVLSLAMLCGLLWLQQIQLPSLLWQRLLKASLFFMLLWVLSSVMVRALHHLLNTPLWSVDIWHNGAVQLSLTLLWTLLACVGMTVASRKAMREVWYMGACILAIVVFKLALLDLSQSATLTRVISFIGAGGMMLIIAYLAPLPPVSPQPESSAD